MADAASHASHMTTTSQTSDLVYYMHDGAAAFRLQLAGALSQETVRDLAQACHTASSTFRGRHLIVDLTGVVHIDDSGRRLLDEWPALGAELVAASSRAKARIQSMITLPVTVVGPNVKSWTWLPRVAGLSAQIGDTWRRFRAAAAQHQPIIGGER